MKVKELMTLLEQEDPDARVVVNGYEGGYEDVGSIHPCPIIVREERSVQFSDLFGTHRRPKDHEDHDEIAVLIPR